MQAQIENARRILSEVRADLMARPNVTATGIGWKITNGQKTDTLALVCSVESKQAKDSLLKMAMDSKAAVFGYDTDGVTGYYLSSENSILGYVHEGFEAIGSGKYASGLVFGQDFKTKTLKMRQAGYAPAEGLIALIDSAFLASEHFKEVGGTLHFILFSTLFFFLCRT